MTSDEVKVKYQTIKAALGMPPYTMEKLMDLINHGTDPIQVRAAKDIVWLISDFVQNWETALARQDSSYGAGG